MTREQMIDEAVRHVMRHTPKGHMRMYYLDFATRRGAASFEEAFPATIALIRSKFGEIARREGASS